MKIHRSPSISMI